MGYDILLPSLTVIGSYLGTYTLYKGGLIKKSLHVNVWNLIIGLAFLISGGAGFVLLVLMDLKVALPISPQLLYWHVELGITLAFVTLFHFHAYWKSARNMFSKVKRRSRA
jgi:hypothetical protein